jgi:hypothetical protein
MGDRKNKISRSKVDDHIHIEFQLYRSNDMFMT